jgi:integrase
MNYIDGMMDEVENCLAECRHAKATDELYRHYMRLFFSWLEKNHLTLDQVYLVKVKIWLDGQGWSSSTQHSAAAAIRLFVCWKFGGKHPLARLRIRREDPGPQRTLTAKQLEQLLLFLTPESKQGISAYHKAIRNLAIVAFMADTGVRAAELCALTLENLKIEDKTAWVLGKGNKWRPVVFSSETIAHLERWLEIRDWYALPEVKVVFVGEGGTRTGTQLTTAGLRKIYRDLGKTSGIGMLSPHDMRRTMATLSQRNGAPSRLVQIQGGWTDLKLVERYSQALTSEDFAPYSPMKSHSQK